MKLTVIPLLALLVPGLASGLASCAAVPVSAPAQASAPPRASADALENRLSMYLGQRSLDEDDWEPVEDQLTIGMEYSRETEDSVVGFEVGLFASGADEEVGGVDVEGQTLELYGGLRKTFGHTPVRPYLGAGVAAINAEAEAGGSDDDTSFAGYAHGGIAFQVSHNFSIGLDLRVLFGSDLEIAGFETDADYGQLALVLAVGF